MLNLINLTQARNNLSRLIDEVVLKKKPFILIRDSLPQAVIIPYEQYQKQEEEWGKEFFKLMKRSQRRFKDYLKNKKIKYPKTEEKMYEMVNQVTGRD
jgi:prevent-host-death family protein